jgi:hypothetical protein
MSDEPAESAHEALTVAIARAMLQVTHIVGAKQAHDELKAALTEFDPEHVPEAYRDANPSSAEEVLMLEHSDHGDDAE